jgi:hypothetical protein
LQHRHANHRAAVAAQKFSEYSGDDMEHGPVHSGRWCEASAASAAQHFSEYSGDGMEHGPVHGGRWCEASAASAAQQFSEYSMYDVGHGPVHGGRWREASLLTADITVNRRFAERIMHAFMKVISSGFMAFTYSSWNRI